MSGNAGSLANEVYLSDSKKKQKLSGLKTQTSVYWFAQ